jgi:hypothetical protein
LLAVVVAKNKINNDKKCRQIAGDFDCHANAVVQCGAWLGIPMFGSNFWDPHQKQNSDFVFDSKDSSRIFF